MPATYFPENALKFSHEQIMGIIDKLVPLIADHEDEAFFRMAIYIKLAESTAPEAAVFVKKLLDKASATS